MNWMAMVALNLDFMRILLPGALIVALLASSMRHHFKLKRYSHQLASWLDAMRQGDFSTSRVPHELLGDYRIERAATAFSTAITSQIGHLNEAAQLDPLTRLHNREFFRRLVSPLIGKMEEGQMHALLFIDVDGFKQINDTLGHNLGDRLLQIAADRLRLSVRIPKSTSKESLHERDAARIGRFGGDEFVAFIPNLPSEAAARKIAARILRVLHEPFELGTHGANISVSIGIAMAPVHGTTYSELLGAADTAMYHAKRSGGNRYMTFDHALVEQSHRLAETEQELRDAVIRGEFVLFFQPLYNVHPFAICSAEALIRWRHPRRGLVPPAEFIPLAERTHLINQIGEWLINEAVKRIAEFARSGHPIMISINISHEQLEQVEFVAMVRAVLQLWKVPPHLLQIEITENVAMRDSNQAAERLRQISEIGVSIAIDDFGTGYSNLASLIELPFDRLKIDRSLIQDLTTRTDAQVLVQTIITMADSLGLKTVAEGVETFEQFDMLSAMGCNILQGFYMSRPVSLDRFSAMLADETITIPPLSNEYRRGIGPVA